MAPESVQDLAGVKATDDTPAEVKFFWRRTVTFAWLIVTSVMLFFIILNPRMDANALMWIGVTLIASNICMAFFYMAGASAVDMAKVFQGLSGLRPRRRRTYDDYYDEGRAGDGGPI